MPAARGALRWALQTAGCIAPACTDATALPPGERTRRMIFEPEHELLREAVARVFRTQIAPHSQTWRDQGYVDREAFRKAGAQGYLLLWAPEEYGGAGIPDYRYEQILCEENIRHGDSGFYANLHSMVVAPYIAKFGSE